MVLAFRNDVVVLLGHGADEHQGAAVADAVRSIADPTSELVVLRGTFDGAWWEGDELDPAACAALCAHLDAAVELLTAPLLVVGFSQGAAAALAWLVGPDRTTEVAALAAVAGFVPPGVSVDGEGAVDRPPVLLVIPEDDVVVDPFLGGRAARLLHRRGHPTTQVEIAGGHAWSPAVTEAARAWWGSLRG